MSVIFDEKELNKNMEDKLKEIKKINFQKTMVTLSSTLEEKYTIIEEDDLENAVVVKADKKKNVPNIINEVIEELKDIVGTEDNEIINLSFDINSYNNMVYIRPKY